MSSETMTLITRLETPNKAFSLSENIEAGS